MKSKKQNVVSCSSATPEYKAATHSECEIMWIYRLMLELGLKHSVPAKLWYDNEAALRIASTPMFNL